MSDLQLTLLFHYVPVAILLIIYVLSGADTDDDDDDEGGKGIRLQPAYLPS